MHFHHRHDVAGCTSDHPDWPDWAVTILATFDRMELIRMSAEQDAIAALAERFAAFEARVEAKLAAAQPAPLDLSPLTAVADKLDALVPADAPAPAAPVEQPAPAPADVPAEQPAAPAVPAPVDVQPAADGTQPVQSIPSVPLA